MNEDEDITPAERVNRLRRARAVLRERRKLIACGALAIGAAATAVVGTMSTFTTAIPRTQSVASGTFVFNLADPASGAFFSTAISGLAPGDFGDRLVTLTNTGTISFASVGLGITVGTPSLLDTDATNGLTLKIDNCAVPWTQASNTVAATCTPGSTALTAAAALSALKASGPSYTTGLLSLTAGGTDYLRFHYVLPAASTGTAGLTSDLTHTFTATQVTGGAGH